MKEFISIQLALIPRAIFSPLSGGKAKPRMLIKEINTQGNTKLNMK